MKSRVFFMLVVVGLAFSQRTTGQQSLSLPKAEQIHQLMRFYEEERSFNGNILVIEDDKLIYENAIGWADQSAQIGLTLSTPFYLASISKSFTATAIIQLEEKGQLDYNDRIVRYFPQLGYRANRITIHHLLTHTSGLPDYFQMEWDEPGLTNAQVFELLVENLGNPKPGEKYAYCNTGYILLAMIIEKVSGMPYYQYIDEYICQPLQMTSTWVYDIRVPGLLEKNRAIGYDYRLKKENDYSLLTYGDGGIYSTLQDLRAFDLAWYGGKLISRKSVQKALTPVTLNNGDTRNYGYGWVLGSNINGRVISHTGGLNGFRNYFEREIDVKNTIIILSNSSNHEVTAIRNTLVKILDGRPYDFPSH